MICLAAILGMLTVSAQGIYDFKVKNDEGKDVSLAQYKGKVILVVNTLATDASSNATSLPTR